MHLHSCYSPDCPAPTQCVLVCVYICPAAPCWSSPLHTAWCLEQSAQALVPHVAQAVQGQLGGALVGTVCVRGEWGGPVGGCWRTRGKACV